MEWYHMLGILIPIAGMIWAMHRETHKEMKEFHEDIKDFHGRLCRLEEKYIQIMQDRFRNS